MTTPNADANGTIGSGAAGAGAAGAAGAAGEGEEIKDWSDVKKAFAKRDELKGEVKDLRTLVEGIGQKLEQLVKPPAGQQQQGQPPAAGQGAQPQGQQATPQGGEAPKPGSIEETVANLAKIVTGLATDKTDVIKAQRRKTVEDTVIAAAKPESKELVRGALAMLALDGHVDLHAEDSAAQVEKALTKLRAGNPGHFAAAQGSAPAPNGQQNPIPPGAEAHELTPEQLARLSDEDFSKLRRQSRTSGLAV